MADQQKNQNQGQQTPGTQQGNQGKRDDRDRTTGGGEKQQGGGQHGGGQHGGGQHGGGQGGGQQGGRSDQSQGGSRDQNR